MSNDLSRPATQADIKFLAELVMQNTAKLEEHDNRFEELEDRLGGRIDSLEEKMESGFRDIKKMIDGIGRYITTHEDRLNDHQHRIHALETTA